MGFQAEPAGVKNETRKVFSMIFDYSNYTERCGSRGVVLYKSVETNTDLFAEEAKCPFCADSHLTTVYSKEKRIIRNGYGDHLTNMKLFFAVITADGGNTIIATKAMLLLMESQHLICKLYLQR